MFASKSQSVREIRPIVSTRQADAESDRDLLALTANSAHDKTSTRLGG